MEDFPPWSLLEKPCFQASTAALAAAIRRTRAHMALLSTAPGRPTRYGFDDLMK